MAAPIPDGDDEIVHYNAQFLERLTGKEWLGVDKDGRLYEVKGLQCIVYKCASRLFKQGIDQRIQDSLQESLAGKKAEWVHGELPGARKEFYDGLIRKLSITGCLSDDNRLMLINDYYEGRYQTLLAAGKTPFEAEATVTIEMSQDPNVPADLKNLIKPTLAGSGINGTYFIKNRLGAKIGVFKPMDEESQMPHNPRGSHHTAEYDPANPMRYIYYGHTQGSGWKKEVAASMIDRDSIFDVPPTVRFEVLFPRRQGSAETVLKQGSLQQFVQGESLDLLTNDEVMALPTDQVQKIVLLDLLLGNADRNLGNCLVQRETGKLIPIDHGFTLLDSADWRGDNQPTSEINSHLATLPQLQQPMSREMAKWVLSLNGDQIADDLRRRLDFSESSIREFKIRLMILQKALSQGRALSDIVPMFMLPGPGCLFESCCRGAAKRCQEFENEWAHLPPEAAARKRFETYFNIVQKNVEEGLY